MSNTLTGLIPTIYKAADIVSREMVGFIPSVFLDASAEKAAVGQTIRYPVAPAGSPADIVAAATGPDPSGETIGYGDMSISKSRGGNFEWTGEEVLSLGSAHEVILRDQFAQAMRSLVNEVEADLAALYVHASRAYGTAGTTPFGSNLGAAAQVLRILKDNGAPGDFQLVINTAAGANLRSLTQLNKANEAGTTMLRERGVLLPIFDMTIRESAQIRAHTKGSRSSYQTAGAVASGVTSVAVDTGSGTVLAGDVVTFAADGDNKYIVGTGISAPGTLALNEPGARVTIPDNNAMTIGGSYVPSLAFSRSALRLLVRVPTMPAGGDSADDIINITDPVSGITFQVALYRQRRRVVYEVGLAWGVAAVKSEHIAILLG